MARVEMNPPAGFTCPLQVAPNPDEAAGWRTRQPVSGFCWNSGACRDGLGPRAHLRREDGVV